MRANPKILLVNPPSNRVTDDRVEPPLGLLYIASTLRERGYENIELFDMTGCKNEFETDAKIKNISYADIYGFTCIATNYEVIPRIILQIRKLNSSAYIAIGGTIPTGIPEMTLYDSKADVVIIGEGEDIFASCVKGYIEGKPLKGVVNGIGRININSYSFPARDLVDISSYSRRKNGRPTVSLLCSRGCIHHCVHCNSVVMGGGNKNVRFRNADNIIKEVESLREHFEYFRFNDDHFTGNPNLEEILIRIKDFDINFRIFARVEDLNAKWCKLLSDAGCREVVIGLESLNPDNLKMLGKYKQLGKEMNVKIAKDYRLIVKSSFMVGLPYDSDETIEFYFHKAANIGLDEFAVYPLIPYPGTLIWKNPEKFGYEIINPDFRNYVKMGIDRKSCFALRHKNFTQEDVQRWIQMANDILKGS